MAALTAATACHRPKQRRLARFAGSGGFLGVGGWRPDPVPMLTAASAADELRQLHHPGAALLWLDEGRRELVVTLRCAPPRLDVGACAAVACRSMHVQPRR